MPETITRTYEAYTIDELDGTARDNAMQTLALWAVEDYEWWDSTIENFVETVETEGVIEIATRNGRTVGGRTYTDPCVFFSGFWSQGDGASFAGKVDVAAYLKLTKQAGKKRALYNWAIDQGCGIRIKTTGNYSHEYSMYVDCDYNDFHYTPDGKATEQAAGLEDEILEWARDKARQLYKDLEAEYEYLTSEEVLLENAQANGYRFDDRGKPL